MWLFKDKVASLDGSGMFSGMTDWHSHVLPGVDDGIKTLDESLEVLRHFDAKGVDTLWLTPHTLIPGLLLFYCFDGYFYFLRGYKSI